MTKRNTLKNDAAKVQTLRDIALAFDVAAVDAMVVKLEESFARRDTFERADTLASNSSYIVERNRMLANKRAVSMFFLALGLEPSAVIERKVVATKMFNAKALKKIVELAQFTVGYGESLEIVTRAFLACAIVATERGYETITNEVNRRFLCSKGFSDQFTDVELIAYLDECAHRRMSSGAETQSSQSRNVLDVLGIGAITTQHKHRDAIKLDASHAFCALFKERFMKPLQAA